MNWKQINSGLWKAEEGGYEYNIRISDVHWVITKNGEVILWNYYHKKQSAKQAAEEAYLKLVK